jgi:3-hydroxyisobutyrate dehydrogenase-like beta-hydroxyacid dehydrogenase
MQSTAKQPRIFPSSHGFPVERQCASRLSSPIYDQDPARSRRHNFNLITGIAMRIGFVGLGTMGTPMALRLLAAGYELSVWNRSEERTKPLIHEGAIAAATPAETELGADVVITMLRDDAAYDEVFFGTHRLIDALSPGVLHILCGTISVTLAERFTAEHANRGIDLVAAPVYGQPGDAEAGRLWIVAAGADKALDRARPLLETFSRGITVAGKEPRQAYATKLKADFLPAT